jgi:adenosylmethionine-8-amino-7-oxononanoate aminotransferase
VLTGYAHDDLAFAQACELSHLRSNFDSIPLHLAKAMTRAAPGDLKRIGFTPHGSLAVEMAMKLATANRPEHTGGRSTSAPQLGRVLDVLDQVLTAIEDS